jgi:hypothetical protein
MNPDLFRHKRLIRKLNQKAQQESYYTMEPVSFNWYFWGVIALCLVAVMFGAR